MLTDTEIEREFNALTAGLTIPDVAQYLKRFALFVRRLETETREAERGKGEPRCQICGAIIPPEGHLCGGRADYGGSSGTAGKMGPSNATTPTPYADKVLEVATPIKPILLARLIELHGSEMPMSEMQERSRQDAIAEAEQMIQAANEAARKREGKS